MRASEQSSGTATDSFKVTSVRKQLKKPDRVSIYSNDLFVIGVHREVVAALKIRPGVVLTRRDIDSAKRKDSFYRARAAALDMIASRQRTKSEVARSLAGRGFPQETVDAVVSDLTSSGLVDDAALAKEFVSQRVRSAREGGLRIKSKLLRRGVPREVIEETVAAAEPDADWKSAALAEGYKKWKSIPAGVDFLRRKKRLHDHLARRGFEFDIIREVINEITQ